MTRLIEEQISAFLDGELSAEEAELLVRRLENEDGHRFTLARYGLIGECVRGATSELALGLHRRVGERLADVEVPAPESGPRSWRVAAGVAACVVTLFAVTMVAVNRPDLVPGSGAGSQTAEFAAVTAPGPSGTAQELTLNRVSATDGNKPESESVIEPARLTQYLVYHGGYSGSFSRQVMDSRIVGQPAAPAPSAGFQRAGWRDEN